MRKTKEGKDEEYGIAADIFGKLYSAYPLYELAFERETDRAGEQNPVTALLAAADRYDLYQCL